MTAGGQAGSIAGESRFARRAARRLGLLMTMILVLASASLAYLVLNDFKRFLAPELARKAHLLGQTVTDDLHRALGFGIPFAELVGANEYAAEIVADYEELAYLAISDRKGDVIYSAGTVDAAAQDASARVRLSDLGDDPADSLVAEGSAPPPPTELARALDYAFPVKQGSEVVGAVHIGIDRFFIERQLDDMVYDLLVILLLALLVAFEIMLAVILFYISGPIEQLGRLIDLYARGNFSNVLKSRTRDSIGRLTQHLSDSARNLHRRYHDLSTRVNERLSIRSRDVSSTQLLGHLNGIGERFGLNVSRLTPLMQAGVHDIRIPLFVFAFAAELQQSFLPLFVRTMYEPIPGLKESVVIGLPIAVYLLVLAFAAPYAGVWSDRYGSRRIFLVGLIPAAAGFIGCAFAESVPELILWRGTTAVGYAMGTIACQEYVIGASSPGGRARSVAVFVAIIMSATMCGTAIGGILYDRLGHRAVFMIAAVLAIAAGLIAQRMLNAELGATTSPREQIAEQSEARLFRILTVLKNYRFVLFLLLVAIPTNVLLAAFLWYIVPLYLFDLDATPAEIGRTMMVYYLIIVAAGSLASHLADRRGGLVWFVALGSVLSGVGLVAFCTWHSIWAVVFAVVIMGVSHAFSRAPQLAVVLEMCEREVKLVGRTPVLSLLRSLERLGSIVGLLLAAALVDLYGYALSMGVTGMMVSGAALVYLLSVLALRARAVAA